MDYYDDDFGPPDSPDGDSEADHVWADVARTEYEGPIPDEDCPKSPDGYCSYLYPTSETCHYCGK